MLHNSYTMCTRGLPDIYTLSPRACGPWASGVYIRQTTRAHGITTRQMLKHRGARLSCCITKKICLCALNEVGAVAACVTSPI